MARVGPEKLVFVGGAPRSGTTVTHAVLCTSARVSRYHPEISFFRGLPLAYRNGRASWKQHTHAFFDTPEAFRQLMRETADVPLRSLWRTLGEPPILCMKDPLLTPLFRDLHMLYPDEASFVVVVRHPVDVVRSRQEVHERSRTGRPFGPGDAAAVANEYLSYYQGVLSADFGGTLLLVRYEDLNAPQTKAQLASFIGVDDLFARPMWGDVEVEDDDPWNSPKYNQAVNLEPRLSPLAPELVEPTMRICAPIAQRFGYELP